MRTRCRTGAGRSAPLQRRLRPERSGNRPISMSARILLKVSIFIVTYSKILRVSRFTSL